MIQFDDVSLYRGIKLLFSEASFQIHAGYKIGVVGRNGCGKSSLFAMLKGELHSDTGYFSIPKEWKKASVAQETPATDKPALEYVIDGDTHYRELQQELSKAEAANDGVQMGHVLARIQDCGGDTIESRAASILAGLGFAQDAILNPVTSFSGGWRMRLNLAQALLCDSDILLLDEPTNHLDLDAVIWLEKWLNSYQGTLVLISHDREFLDSCVGHIISFESQKLKLYKGNYSNFEVQRAEASRLNQLQYEKQQAKAAHLQKYIDRFGAKASKAKQAQSRKKQLERMVEILPNQQEAGFGFSFQEPSKLPNPLVYMEKVELGYATKTVLSDVKLNLVPGSRIGMLGRNGAGKSTLIKSLAGEIKVLSGDYSFNAGLTVGYFSQHQLEVLDDDASPVAHLQLLDKKATEQELRDYLGKFGFSGDETLSAVGPMSGGEKARLVLALIVYQKPNLLLLDEPTNHLDMVTRTALSLALQDFTGAMIIVSHDRFLLNSVCDEFYLVDAGSVSAFDGDLNVYYQWLSQAQSESADANIRSEKLDKGLSRKDKKRLEAEFRKSMQPIKKELASLEKRMEKLHARESEIQQLLLSEDMYQSENKDKLKNAIKEQSDIKVELEDAEVTWLDLQESIENKAAEFENELSSI